MMLGIINGWEEGHFKAVKEKGLEAVEFCINDKYDSAEVLKKAEEIKGYSKKYNIKIGSTGRWGMTRIDENGQIIPEALQHDKNIIDFASIVRCPVFNVGCNYIDGKTYYENCQFAIAYFSQLIEYARPKNVKIATYNCDWANFVYDEKAWTVIHGALPELGINGCIIKPVTEKFLLPWLHTKLTRDNDLKFLSNEKNTLLSALENRRLVEEANGIIAVSKNVSIAEADKILTEKAKEKNVTKEELAKIFVSVSAV